MQDLSALLSQSPRNGPRHLLSRGGMHLHYSPDGEAHNYPSAHLRAVCPCAGCRFHMSVWLEDSASILLSRFFKTIPESFLCPDCKLHGHLVALDWK